ncbi:Nucleolar protein 16 [Leucoagaricus sp. SymC.cos]|nr:Nucleolar protein 16 [Leucoagaricus sp. SymC.cos]
MANPRQRRKARSSSHRPVMHSRSAKRNLKKTPTIRGPKALQEVWDKRRTVKQNYAALGLAHTLNPGGTENRPAEAAESEIQPGQQRILPEYETDQLPIPCGFGRIIRDESGNVVCIGINEDSNQNSPDKRDVSLDMRQSEPLVDAEVLAKWSMDENTHTMGTSREKSNQDVMHALKQLSTPQTALNILSFSLSGMGPRRPSTGEVAYLQRLVDKHGDNLAGMAQDHRLNPEQRTIGQLQSSLHRLGLYG